uniref:Uncharacterized protein n=1 Tax=Clastoptera arizonana TaxID=38151 RepID=A0A1B6EDG3_9HEMI
MYLLYILLSAFVVTAIKRNPLLEPVKKLEIEVHAVIKEALAKIRHPLTDGEQKYKEFRTIIEAERKLYEMIKGIWDTHGYTHRELYVELGATIEVMKSLEGVEGKDFLTRMCKVRDILRKIRLCRHTLTLDHIVDFFHTYEHLHTYTWKLKEQLRKFLHPEQVHVIEKPDLVWPIN